MSASVEFLDMDYELVQLSGAWGRERYVHVRKLDMGFQGIQGLAGTAGGAEQNPFIALKRPETTEFAGEVYGMSLVYSGNFLANAEVSTFDMTRVMLGVSPENFSWKLETGESFTTPEAVLVYSDAGLNGMSRAFHKLYGRRLARGRWRDEPRPILLNNWEPPTACPTSVSASSKVSIFAFVWKVCLYFELSIFSSPATMIRIGCSSTLKESDLAILPGSTPAASAASSTVALEVANSMILSFMPKRSK